MERAGLLLETAEMPRAADRFRVRANAWAALSEQGNYKPHTRPDLAAGGQQALAPGADPAPLREAEQFYSHWLRLFPAVLNKSHRTNSP